jgi:hypothetical protein
VNTLRDCRATPLIERDDGGGPRHYVDDRAVHCGAFLELEVPIDGKMVWLPVRYEATINDGSIRVTLHVPWGIIHPRYNRCVFRWPKEGA